jgi:hypothetical protein
MSKNKQKKTKTATFTYRHLCTGTRIPDPLFPHLVPPAIMVWIFVWKYIFEPFIHILQHFVTVKNVRPSSGRHNLNNWGKNVHNELNYNKTSRLKKPWQFFSQKNKLGQSKLESSYGAIFSIIDGTNCSPKAASYSNLQRSSTISLQERSLDIGRSLKSVNLIQSSLDCRANVEQFNHQYF